MVKSIGKRILRGAWNEIDGKQIRQLFRFAPVLARQTWSYAVKHRVYNSPSSNIGLRVHCEQQPDGSSRVTLGEERDSLGMRRVHLQWAISGLELRTIRVFTAVAKAALEKAGLANVIAFSGLADDDTLRSRCDDGLHHIGGTVMSRDRAQGVVDKDLRFHNLPNLSLCSAAVFPTGGYSNPTHTLLALALRLAHRLTTQAVER